MTRRSTVRHDFEAPHRQAPLPAAKCLDCGHEYTVYPDWRQPCVAVLRDRANQPQRCGGRVIPIVEWP